MASIVEIADQIKTRVQANLPETTGQLANSVLSIFIESIAGVFYTFEKGLSIVRRDSIALTATTKRLEEYGELYGVDRKLIATGNSVDETDEVYRHRVIQRIQYRPHGGTAGDYEAWLLALPNVTHAFVLPNEFNFGEIVLGYKINNAIPTPSFDDQYITDAIDLLRPIGTKIIVAKPIPKPIALKIRINPNNPIQHFRITEELNIAFNEHVFRAGVFYLSWLSEAVSRAVGEIDHDLILPSTNVTIGNYELPQLSTIEFIS
jgi:uncharacterized phage protein gp47/JayE